MRSQAGKHVVCEKPLTVSAEDAGQMVASAQAANRRNCLFHNLRYYPMVQQMRRMREAGDLGEILVVQGTYSQDWLLYDTDWNWRLERKDNGPSRCMADIGSHWCDMAEHVTGQRIASLCADLNTFHKTRKRPKGPIETFAGKMLKPEDYVETPIDTEDFGAVVFRMDNDARGAFTASQVSAGRKNRLSLEIYGTKCGVAWDQERPDELWIGNRNTPNQLDDQGPLANEGRRAKLRRSAGRPQRGIRRYFQAGVPAILRVDRRSRGGARVSAVCGWPAAIDDSGSGDGQQRKTRVGGRAFSFGCQRWIAAHALWRQRVSVVKAISAHDSSAHPAIGRKPARYADTL